MARTRSRDAEFKVEVAHVDGKRGGTLTIFAPRMEARTCIVRYRPRGSRRTYAVTLDEVAEMVASRATKTNRVH